MTSPSILSLSISNLVVLLFLLLHTFCMLNSVDGTKSTAHFSPNNQGGRIARRRTVSNVNHYGHIHAIKKPETLMIREHERVMMDVKEGTEQEKAKNSGTASSALGSKPPSCISKCGSCKPCTPVRVPVQPGAPNNSEYYPEAWRCKCGGKIYMP